MVQRVSPRGVLNRRIAANGVTARCHRAKLVPVPNYDHVGADAPWRRLLWIWKKRLNRLDAWLDRAVVSLGPAADTNGP